MCVCVYKDSLLSPLILYVCIFIILYVCIYVCMYTHICIYYTLYKSHNLSIFKLHLKCIYYILDILFTLIVNIYKLCYIFI